MVKRIILVFSSFILLSLIFASIYFFILLQPSNNRNWEFGFQTLPNVIISGNNVTIKKLRDYSFTENNVTEKYTDQTVDVSQLERVWFVVEPFTIKPFTNFKGVAHTYFVFDFKDHSPIVVSVEARREKGEKYDAWIGLLNQYELIYVWGTETDETIRRVVIEHNQLYMYPLTISTESAQKLFLEVASSTHDLENHPRFYNTFLSNCTNELAKAANKVKPNSVPLNIALFLPGYSEQELYKLGYIPNQQPLDQIKQSYYISDYVKQLYADPDFSQKLREKLLAEKPF